MTFSLISIKFQLPPALRVDTVYQRQWRNKQSCQPGQIWWGGEEGRGRGEKVAHGFSGEEREEQAPRTGGEGLHIGAEWGTALLPTGELPNPG